VLVFDFHDLGRIAHRFNVGQHGPPVAIQCTQGEGHGSGAVVDEGICEWHQRDRCGIVARDNPEQKNRETQASTQRHHVGITLELSCGATRAGPGLVYARRSPRQLQ
jgi:hypothetical protein